MSGQGQLLHSAWMLDAEIQYPDDLTLTQFAPQNKNSAGSATFTNWWFGTIPAVPSSVSGLGGKLHSAWMLVNYPDALLLTQFLPQNKNSAGGAAMTDWWFGPTVGFFGAAFSAATGNLKVSISVPLVGAAITSATGTLAAFGVSGISRIGYMPVAGPGVGPFANVQFTPQLPGYAFGFSVPLTGAAITAVAGNLIPVNTQALTGVAVTSAAGTLTPAAGTVVALVGQSFAAKAGSFAAVSIDMPLTGNAVTVTAGTLSGGSGFRVMATAIGEYGGILYGPGDVFDIADQSDFADSSIDYAAGNVGDPMFGWMKQVPPSTPLTYPLTDPIYDFQKPPRRTVF